MADRTLCAVCREASRRASASVSVSPQVGHETRVSPPEYAMISTAIPQRPHKIGPGSSKSMPAPRESSALVFKRLQSEEQCSRLRHRRNKGFPLELKSNYRSETENRRGPG
jgi:hypothetical protein